MFGFQKHATLVSFTPKKNKSVVLLSTMHRDAAVDAETKKPEIIYFYNSTKGGIDTVANSVAIILCQGEPVGGLHVSFSIS